MRPTLLLAALVAAVAPSPAESASYALDDQHTSVVFAVSHFGFSYCYGMFGKYSGQFEATPGSPDGASFEFTVDASSLDTKSEKRDEHLRGPDFFNVSQFPDITFKSTSVTAAADGRTWNVAGDLTMHGVTRQVTLPLKYLGAGKGPYGKRRIGFAGGLTVKRSDYGMTTFLPNIGDDVRLMVSFEGIQQLGAGGAAQ